MQGVGRENAIQGEKRKPIGGKKSQEGRRGASNEAPRLFIYSQHMNVKVRGEQQREGD